MTQHPIARWRSQHPPISRTRLAREVGISQPSLLQIERGDTQPSADTLRALVAATEALRPGQGLTAGQVLGIEEYNPAAVPGAGEDATSPAADEAAA